MFKGVLACFGGFVGFFGGVFVVRVLIGCLGFRWASFDECGFVYVCLFNALTCSEHIIT